MKAKVKKKEKKSKIFRVCSKAKCQWDNNTCSILGHELGRPGCDPLWVGPSYKACCVVSRKHLLKPWKRIQ